MVASYDSGPMDEFVAADAELTSARMRSAGTLSNLSFTVTSARFVCAVVSILCMAVDGNRVLSCIVPAAIVATMAAADLAIGLKWIDAQKNFRSAFARFREASSALSKHNTETLIQFMATVELLRSFSDAKKELEKAN